METLSNAGGELQALDSNTDSRSTYSPTAALHSPLNGFLNSDVAELEKVNSHQAIDISYID